jgi:hypothetical protein
VAGFALASADKTLATAHRLRWYRLIERVFEHELVWQIGFHSWSRIPTLTTFFSADTIVESMSPILDQMVDATDKPTFTVGQHASFNLTLTTKDGFTYGFDHNRIHVTFNHKIRAKAVSGGPPVMEMLSTPKPYTKLLADVCDRLLEATLNLPSVPGRRLMGAGVISAT